MTHYMKPVFDDIAERFGLGSSTRGMTMDEANRGRTEAEARAERAAKPKVRCKQGESFEQMVEREKREAFNRAQLARRDYIAALEDARRAGSIIQHAHDVFDDLEGDCWADIQRAEG